MVRAFVSDFVGPEGTKQIVTLLAQVFNSVFVAHGARQTDGSPKEDSQRAHAELGQSQFS